MEIILVFFFGVEYVVRLWSAGCRSKYYFNFRKKKIRSFCIVLLTKYIYFIIGKYMGKYLKL